MLPQSAFAGFAARFKEPRLKEGFQDIVTIEFQVAPDSRRMCAHELKVFLFSVSGQRRTAPNLESVLDMKLAEGAYRPIESTRIATFHE